MPSDELLQWLQTTSRIRQYTGAGETLPRRRNNITAAELPPLVSYLEAPTQHGYWRLSAKWKSDGAFSEFVFDTLKPHRVARTANRTPTSMEERAASAIASSTEREFESATQRITPLFEAFAAAVQPTDNPQMLATRKQYLGEPWQHKLDLNDFRNKFSEALNIFKNDIYYEDMQTSVQDEVFRFEKGLVWVLLGPRSSNQIIIVGFDLIALQAMGSFLRATGQIENPTYERIFAPEEELFQPYFVVLSAAFDRMINDYRNQPQFKQAFDYFSRADYLHCISTLGLIGEDYLAQVYETYLRDPIPRGNTLGQLYDLFHSQLKQLTQPVREELKPLDSLYREITELQKKEKSDDSVDSIERIATLMRDLLTAIRADRKYFSQKMDDVTRRDARVSLFPLRVRENLIELIRHRNAASHKSRIPLGNYEALRALYCLTSFVLWWKKQRSATDWSLDKYSIIKNAIEQAAKKSPL